jgi:hypothetical protein
MAKRTPRLRACLIAAGMIVATFLSLNACDSSPSLNDVSRYAQRCHDLLYADAAATSFFMHSDEHSPQELYDVAKRMADDAAGFSVGFSAPSGFSDSDYAWDLYARGMSDSYGKIAQTLNDPSLANSHDMVEAIHENTANLAKAITAFKHDLANSPFTKKEKRRVLNRLL